MKYGIGFLIVAMALTPLTDGFSKLLVYTQSAFFVCFARYLSAGCFASLYAIATGRTIHIPWNDLLGQTIRTALMMSAMICLIIALSMVPLAKAIGGFLVAPVFASLMSIIFLGEKIDMWRIIGAVISFIGACIILRPEGSIELGAFFALIGGCLLGGYLTATRGAGFSGGCSFSAIIFQCFLGALMVLPLALWKGIPQIDYPDLILISALGVSSAICHLLTIAAYRRVDASILAPFFYFNVIFAIPIGYVWFDETLRYSTLVGIVVIVIGGLSILLSSKYTILPMRELFYKNNP